MITFFEIGALGRLGNQLFQYAALRSLGLKNGYEVKIPPPQQREWHGQRCLLGEFNIPVSYLKQEDLSVVAHIYQEPDYMSFDEDFFQIPDNTNLHGFFQSTYYFDRFEEIIKRELTPQKTYMTVALETIYKLKEQYPEHQIASLHLRRGDNTDDTDPAQKALNNSYGKAGSSRLAEESFYYQYLQKALEIFKGQKVKFLVFSGGQRGETNKEDMEWCKRSFKGDDFIFSENRTTMQDFSLIMSCDHNIISHVSSFGWWAAYLNPNKNKTVVAPVKYHPDRLDIDYRKGFYPSDWRLV